MNIMIAELYDALKEAGSSAHTARQAAQAVASQEKRMTGIETGIRHLNVQIRAIKWMMGFFIVLAIATFGMTFQTFNMILQVLKAVSPG